MQVCTFGRSFCAPQVSLGAHANALRPDISTSSDSDDEQLTAVCRYGCRLVCYYTSTSSVSAPASDSCEVCLIAPRHIKMRFYVDYLLNTGETIRNILYHFCLLTICPSIVIVLSCNVLPCYFVRHCLVLHFQRPQSGDFL